MTLVIMRVISRHKSGLNGLIYIPSIVYVYLIYVSEDVHGLKNFTRQKFGIWPITSTPGEGVATVVAANSSSGRHSFIIRHIERTDYDKSNETPWKSAGFGAWLGHNCRRGGQYVFRDP